MKIIDLHCDTILQLLMGKSLTEETGTHVSLEKLRRGDWMAQCFAIFVPFAAPDSSPGIPGTAAEFLEQAYARFRAALDSTGGAITQVRSTAALRQAREQGQIAAILTVENCVSLDGELARLDGYAAKGVKMAGLIWNDENSLAYPNSPDPALHSLGLKPFGIDCVRRMNALGIAVDVSHLNEGGFWDVARHSAKPFIASHSCARALCDHPRNLTDRQLRALGDAGGLVGVNYCADFLHDNRDGSANRSETEEVVRHLRHMANVAGEDAVALGSDYDGIQSELSWGDAGGQQVLVRAMEPYFTPAQIEKICWQNALRVFAEIWGE